MIRTFHPIGQGAFYTEEFDEFTMVYDCGSANKIGEILLIEKEIRNTFEKGKVIDAVFISHLHNDHVNGLEFLLNYCNVKKLFLPLLSVIEKIDLIIQNEIISNGTSDFIELLIKNQDSDRAEVILVPSTSIKSYLDLDQEPIFIEDKIDSNILKSNPKISSRKIPEWLFIPFNFKQAERKLALKKRLKEKPNYYFTKLSDFEEAWRDEVKRKEIIERYKKIPGSLNTNSMTVYSGPEKNDLRYFFNFTSFHYLMFKNYNSACMYFGDYDTKGKIKWNQFTSQYNCYWEKVGTVQCPHHGSRHNYNREINQNPKITILSAGYNNQYHHPHSITVKNILLDRGCPIIVTEHIGSRMMFHVHGI